MPAPKAKSIAVAVAVAIGALSSTSGAAPQQFAQQSAPAPAPQLIDPQITHVIYRAGHNDIVRAKLALEKSQNPDVRAFATGVLNNITPVDNDVVKLEQKLQIHPQDSDLEGSEEQNAKNVHQRLGMLSGKEFDQAYAETEVAFYRRINSALRGRLVPSAQNPELKSLVQNAASVFQRQQQEAEQLAKKLGVVG